MTEDISLYRKYRPQTFEHLVGQEHVSTTLLNALRKKQLAHAYLFCGPRGTGKTSTARLVAKGLNCKNLQKNAEPCNSCDICISVNEGRLIDIVEIDAASNRGIDEIRDLREKIKFAPTYAAKKVYIIDEVHMLTKEAFNALLKTLEEPPIHVHFILATTESHKVPDTIISRCQRFDFKRIMPATIVKRLQTIAQEENIQTDPLALKLIADYADGGLRDAIGLMEQMTASGKVTFEHVKEYLGLSGLKEIESFIDLLLKRKITEALNAINVFYQSGIDLSQFVKECLDYLREELLSAVSEDNVEAISLFIQLISLFQEANEGIKSAIIPQLPVEMAIIKSGFGDRTHRRLDTLESQVPSKKISISPSSISPKKESSSAPTPSQEDDSRDNRVMPSSLETVKSQWPRVLDHIKTPSLKRSLSCGILLVFENDTIDLGFTSLFHKEKIESIEHQKDLYDALSQVFISPLKIQCQILERTLESESSENLFRQHAGIESLSGDESVDSDSIDEEDAFIEKAAKLFEGESS